MADNPADPENSVADTLGQDNGNNDSAAAAVRLPISSASPVEADGSPSVNASNIISTSHPPTASPNVVPTLASPSPPRGRSRGEAAPLQPRLVESSNPDPSAVVRDALERPRERQASQPSSSRRSITPTRDPRIHSRDQAPNSSSPSGSQRAGSVGEFRGEGSPSASPQPSPEMNRQSVVLGVGARELDVGPRCSDELEISVPSYQDYLTSDGQRYTTYEIVVRMGGRQWSVRRRYSQFDQFRHSLRKQHKEVGSFRFPNKSKFNTFAEHTKERRRTGFDEFLRLVAGLHPRPQEVDIFLAMDEHGAGVSARGGGRPIAWTTGNVSPVSTAPTVPAPSGPGFTGVTRRLPSGSVSGRQSKSFQSSRMPRFPPLADQGRAEKATEAAASAVAAAASRTGPSGVIHRLDLTLKRVLGPEVMGVLCVVAVSTASIVVVWKVGGRPGIVTLVICVCVGLLVQSWEAGRTLLNVCMGLEGVGGSTTAAPEPPPSARHSLVSSGHSRPSDSDPAGTAPEVENQAQSSRN